MKINWKCQICGKWEDHSSLIPVTSVMRISVCPNIPMGSNPVIFALDPNGFYDRSGNPVDQYGNRLIP